MTNLVRFSPILFLSLSLGGVVQNMNNETQLKLASAIDNYATGKGNDKLGMSARAISGSIKNLYLQPGSVTIPCITKTAKTPIWIRNPLLPDRMPNGNSAGVVLNHQVYLIGIVFISPLLILWLYNNNKICLAFSVMETKFQLRVWLEFRTELGISLLYLNYMAHDKTTGLVTTNNIRLIFCCSGDLVCLRLCIEMQP